jgi:hypothetical protein
MSGGYFNYTDSHLSMIADEIEELVENNNSTEVDSWGYKVGRDYSPEVIEVFKKTLGILKKASIYVHEIDYLVSGDNGEEGFLRNVKSKLKSSEENTPTHKLLEVLDKLLDDYQVAVGYDSEYDRAREVFNKIKYLEQ